MVLAVKHSATHFMVFDDSKSIIPDRNYNIKTLI